ncbi:hypothetical protein ACFL2A_02660 [Thermodesulfobacteriota bacterium]
MRYYYDAEFIHIIDHHKDEIMENLREDYIESIISLVESFLYERISERELVDEVKEYIVCAAEPVCEDHEA